MKLQQVMIAMGLSVLMMSVQAAPSILVLTKTLESVTIEVLYNNNAEQGRLIARQPDCASCTPVTLTVTGDTKAFLNDKPVSTDTMRQWQGVTADVTYDKNSLIVKRIGRY